MYYYLKKANFEFKEIMEKCFKERWNNEIRFKYFNLFISSFSFLFFIAGNYLLDPIRERTNGFSFFYVKTAKKVQN